MVRLYAGSQFAEQSQEGSGLRNYGLLDASKAREARLHGALHSRPNDRPFGQVACPSAGHSMAFLATLSELGITSIARKVGIDRNE